MNIEKLNFKNSYYKNKIENFLNKNNLDFEEVENIYGIYDYNGELIATVGRYKNILKYFAIDKNYQGQDLLSLFLTKLIDEINEEGYRDIFVYTLSENALFFKSNAFKEISHAKDTILLNRRDNFLEDYEKYIKHGKNGVIVLNANPFTLGHRYLVEKSAKVVDNLYLFVVEEDKSRFSFERRKKMVIEGTSDIKNVIVVPSGEYIISSATFPTYFLKDKSKAQRIYAELDARLFKNFFVPKFNFVKRFVGDESLDESTLIYNKVLKEVLEPECELVEIERLEKNNQIISASYIRKNLDNIEKIEDLVPRTTLKEIL